MKSLIILLLVLILFSLFSALLHLVRDRGKGKRTVHALTWRIGLSFALFALLLLATWLGWIQPHGLTPPAP